MCQSKVIRVFSRFPRSGTQSEPDFIFLPPQEGIVNRLKTRWRDAKRVSYVSVHVERYYTGAAAPPGPPRLGRGPPLRSAPVGTGSLRSPQDDPLNAYRQHAVCERQRQTNMIEV